MFFFFHLNFKSSYTTSPLVATMWKKMLHAPEANALQPIRERPSVQTLLTNHTALFVLRIIFHIERNRWRAVKKRYAKKKIQKKKQDKQFAKLWICKRMSQALPRWVTSFVLVWQMTRVIFDANESVTLNHVTHSKFASRREVKSTKCGDTCATVTPYKEQ